MLTSIKSDGAWRLRDGQMRTLYYWKPESQDSVAIWKQTLKSKTTSAKPTQQQSVCNRNKYYVKKKNMD